MTFAKVERGVNRDKYGTSHVVVDYFQVTWVKDCVLVYLYMEKSPLVLDVV